MSSDAYLLSNASNASNCSYEPALYLEEKLPLVAIFGTLVCVVGLLNNCILLRLLVGSTLINSHVFYLAVLAGCDIVAEISYVLLFANQVLFEYTESVTLYYAWMQYVKYVYTLTHLVLTVATYMIVAASAERYFASRINCSPRLRWLVTMGIGYFAVLSKGLVYWEIDVEFRENCTGFGAYTIGPSALAMDPPYRIGYALTFRHIVHVFFPFILLLCLNGAILWRLKRQLALQSALLCMTMGDLAKRRKESLRSATRMLAAIVTTYLISNLLNVIISVWEQVGYASLVYDHPKFYSLATDMVSVMTVFTGAIRMPLYLACNNQLRQRLRELLPFNLGRCFKGRGRGRDKRRAAEDGDYNRPEETLCLRDRVDWDHSKCPNGDTGGDGDGDCDDDAEPVDSSDPDSPVKRRRDSDQSV